MYIKSLKIIKQKAFLKHFLIPSKISVHIETKVYMQKKWIQFKPKLNNEY